MINLIAVLPYISSFSSFYGTIHSFATSRVMIIVVNRLNGSFVSSTLALERRIKNFRATTQH